MFSSWPNPEEEPTWRQRALVIGGFAIAAFIAGAGAAVLPMFELRFHNMWQASLVATAAAFPIARPFVMASRRLEHQKIVILSLLHVVLAYIAFVLWVELRAVFYALLGAKDDSEWQLAVLFGLAVLITTWKLFVPAALLASYAIAISIRRIWPVPG